MKFSRAVVFALLAFACASAVAMDQAQLQRIVGQRLAGDYSGACMAVAVVGKDGVARAFGCADPKDAGRIGPQTVFEIGSVTKTMTAALLADLIVQGKASLDDPLAEYLPAGTQVPSFEGKPILLRHIVTHTSGLPRLPLRMFFAGGYDPGDPYAHVAEPVLLDLLAKTRLRRAPGEKFEYSNFAMMLLSYAVAQRAGEDFESLLRDRLFAPLGMRTAYVNRKPDGVQVAVGHESDGQAAQAWNFATNLAGAGGVRATLDDMMNYVQGNLGSIASPVLPALEFSHRPLGGQPAMGMNWIVRDVGGRDVLWHNGGTGGFSSFVAFDPEKSRGVVVLSDTALHGRGVVEGLGWHLIDDSLPPGSPETTAPIRWKLYLFLGALAGILLLGVGVLAWLLRRRHRSRAGPA